MDIFVSGLRNLISRSRIISRGGAAVTGKPIYVSSEYDVTFSGPTSTWFSSCVSIQASIG